MLYLAFLNQVLHRSRHIFDWHFRVNAVLVEEINNLSLEPLERALHALLDVFRPAVQTHWTRIFLGLELEPELRCDYHLLTKGGEGFAHELFIRERAVDLSRIEECDAAFERSPNDRDHLLLGPHWTVTTGHPHAAETDGRNFEVSLTSQVVRFY